MELTGQRSGDGAKMKADIGEADVTFRGAVKATVPFEALVAEARGSLLILSFGGTTVELAAGSRAAQLASRIRSPPTRCDRLGVQAGMTAAAAGTLDAAFKSELAARATVVPGVPRDPVDVLVFGADAPAQLDVLPKLAALVVPGGTLWVVVPKALPESAVQAALRKAGLKADGASSFGAERMACRGRR